MHKMHTMATLIFLCALLILIVARFILFFFFFLQTLFSVVVFTFFARALVIAACIAQSPWSFPCVSLYVAMWPLHTAVIFYN